MPDLTVLTDEQLNEVLRHTVQKYLELSDAAGRLPADTNFKSDILGEIFLEVRRRRKEV